MPPEESTQSPVAPARESTDEERVLLNRSSRGETVAWMSAVLLGLIVAAWVVVLLAGSSGSEGGFFGLAMLGNAAKFWPVILLPIGGIIYGLSAKANTAEALDELRRRRG